ncbi:MAG TPA: tyrosine-type recombinase/integrase [Spirochaetales bacterium]|nr:tyrosine-type recombinase/integrase [Spirochaetales bacterium]
MVTSAPFTLCRITRSERMYWYALFRNPETGERTNKKSVEKIRKELGIISSSPIRRRDEAIIICQKALDEGIIFGKREPLSLYSYLKEFFDWDTSPYVERRNLLDPGSISKDYIATRQNLISNHILPRINTNLLLSTVTLNQLEQIQLSLVKEGRLASSTINICMGALSLALGEAQRRGLLPGNRTYKVRKLKSMHKARGILSEQELKDFMKYLKSDGERRIYLACLLALLTGMRSGELRALQFGSIGDGVITVDQAYADKAGLKVPKGKKTRYVPCPVFLCDQLKDLMISNPKPNPHHLVFWSKRGGGFVSSHYFSERFQQELANSNILTIEEIKERNITFHSLRHMANTLLRGSVDEHVLRMTIGHSSEQLSDLYTHLSQRGMRSVELAQQNNILPLLGEEGF